MAVAGVAYGQSGLVSGGLSSGALSSPESCASVWPAISSDRAVEGSSQAESLVAASAPPLTAIHHIHYCRNNILLPNRDQVSVLCDGTG